MVSSDVATRLPLPIDFFFLISTLLPLAAAAPFSPPRWFISITLASCCCLSVASHTHTSSVWCVRLTQATIRPDLSAQSCWSTAHPAACSRPVFGGSLARSAFPAAPTSRPCQRRPTTSASRSPASRPGPRLLHRRRSPAPSTCRRWSPVRPCPHRAAASFHGCPRVLAWLCVA